MQRPQGLAPAAQIRQHPCRIGRQVAPVSQLLAAVDQSSAGIFEVRVQAQHRLTIGHRLREALQREERGRAVVEEIDLSRRQKQARVVRLDGLLVAIQHRKHHAAIGHGIDIMRTQRKGPVEGEQRLLEPVEVPQARAPLLNQASATSGLALVARSLALQRLCVPPQTGQRRRAIALHMREPGPHREDLVEAGRGRPRSALSVSSDTPRLFRTSR